MVQIERHDPLGGAFGAALSVTAGDVMVATVSGNVGIVDGEPVFANSFDDQVRLCGEHAATELARGGYTTADILDASVFVHPDVDIAPGHLLDALQQHVFGGTAPALLIMRAASIYPASLIAIKITAMRSNR
jgi:enamine deaminase RidA (YjgF/YER057c/UK114 family)